MLAFLLSPCLPCPSAVVPRSVRLATPPVTHLRCLSATTPILSSLTPFPAPLRFRSKASLPFAARLPSQMLFGTSLPRYSRQTARCLNPESSSGGESEEKMVPDSSGGVHPPAEASSDGKGDGDKMSTDSKWYSFWKWVMEDFPQKVVEIEKTFKISQIVNDFYQVTQNPSGAKKVVLIAKVANRVWTLFWLLLFHAVKLIKERNKKNKSKKESDDNAK